MYYKPYAYPVWTNPSLQRPRRPRRKERAFIIGGFLLALSGGLLLLGDDQARLRIGQRLPKEFAVAIGMTPAAPETPRATADETSEIATSQPAAEPTDIAGQQAGTNRRAPLSPPRPRQETASRRAAPLDRNAQWSERTLAFWKSLNRIMTKEMALCGGGRDGAVAKSTVEGRREISAEFAIKAIRGLDRRYVDVRVQALAEEIVDWYEAELQTGSGHTAALAVSTLLNMPQRHVRRDVDINRRSELLRGKMTDKYRRPFPSLQ